jgi:uncharacterized membrane protein YphA (DoxX/SURF4 family)
MRSHSQKTGWFFVRIGIALVLFWFGIQQLLTPENWTLFLPEWGTALLPIDPRVLVLINGGVEVIFGFFILLGIYLRISAVVIGLHLALIALSLGNTPSAIRDWGLAFAAFALFFSQAEESK